MTRERRTAVGILAAVAVAGGLAGAINGLGADLLADRGPNLWRLYAMNTFGGLLTIVGGAVAIGAASARSKVLTLLAGALFLAMAGLTVIGIGHSYNLFGGRGSTASFWLMLGVGLAALALSPEVDAASDRADR